MTERTDIRGSCHCRNIDYTLSWPAEVKEVPVRACDCTFCRKHGGAWTSHPNARLDVRITGDGSDVYRFGTGTADFHVCKTCGIVPLASCEIDAVRYAVVNVNTFEHRDSLSISRSATSFDGEGTADRLARRQRNWIPGVTYRLNPCVPRDSDDTLVPGDGGSS